MFNSTLLDSAPAHLPVLKRTHWLLSLLSAIAAGVAALYLSATALRYPQWRALILQSFLLGTLAGFYVLGLCYVWEDAKAQGLSRWLWFGVAILLNAPGFLLYLVYSAAKSGNWKRATIPIAYIIQGFLVGVLVLMPLINTQALPRLLWGEILAPLPPPPGPGPVSRSAAPRRSASRRGSLDPMKAPPIIPRGIARIVESPEPAEAPAPSIGVPGGVPNGVSTGVMNSILIGTLVPPPALPAPRSSQPNVVRIGGIVEAAKAIYQPKPEYPALARMARVQGAVRLEAIISRDGTVESLKLLEGSPLLVKAAIDAVSRWRYQPTLLNGEPVEVLTDITVNFTLAE